MIRKSDFVTGHVGRVKEGLCEKLDAFARRYKCICVGATSDPKARAGSYERDDWSEFNLLWKTTSYERVGDVEDMLIKYMKAKEGKRRIIIKKWPRVRNKIGGGTGLSENKLEYFVYIVGK